MRRFYDGVVCFGGSDWWYHNRGHYDMQLCRQFAKKTPVLYVNSIGIRTPVISEGPMFFRRVGRKLKSWSRGFVRVDKHFGVVSPMSVPGRVGRLVSMRLLKRQVQRAAKRMNITSPLAWIECPPAVDVVHSLEPVALVYQRTDRYEEFPGADRSRIRAYDRRLKACADMTLFSSGLLFEQESRDCRSAHYIDHGVDFERFFRAGSGSAAEPEDVSALPRPRIGFIGGIDSHTFDEALLVRVARLLPEATFILVGNCSLPRQWCEADNVYMLGQRPYESVAAYMAACDVLIMPWKQNQWIQACNPVKLKEYLAVGRPVVSTPFDEVRRYEDHVKVVCGPEAFAAAIRDGLERPCDGRAQRERVRNETWSAKAAEVMSGLARKGFVPRARKVAR